MREGEEQFAEGIDGWIFWEKNYKSMTENAMLVERKVREEVDAGFLLCPFSREELDVVLGTYPPPTGKPCAVSWRVLALALSLRTQCWERYELLLMPP